MLMLPKALTLPKTLTLHKALELLEALALPKVLTLPQGNDAQLPPRPSFYLQNILTFKF
jgi:hypothetical protein